MGFHRSPTQYLLREVPGVVVVGLCVLGKGELGILVALLNGVDVSRPLVVLLQLTLHLRANSVPKM